ncbi:MAG: hypothetical protein KA419_07650 [Acidobacteria bacterium]|nr:hypothetical protein [Acidobacteriota bacterium]
MTTTDTNPEPDLSRPLPFVWDYRVSEGEFREILAGRLRRGRFGRDWASLRLLEYGSWADIVGFLGYAGLVSGWPSWRDRVRSESRRRGLDFICRWVPRRHPEWMTSPSRD